LPDEVDGRTIIAGYHWFNDWGRDTLIALPGLTLTTGRPEIARKILLSIARYIDQGMLPNNFPDAGEAPAYNTVDAALWLFEALRQYYDCTKDLQILEQLFSKLAGIIDLHVSGTRYNIKVDPLDALLYAGTPEVQLTWMDAKVGNWVITPRTGKAVEINALWINALHTMSGFAKLLSQPREGHTQLSEILECRAAELLRCDRHAVRQERRVCASESDFCPVASRESAVSPATKGCCGYHCGAVADVPWTTQLGTLRAGIQRTISRRAARAGLRLPPRLGLGLAARALRACPLSGLPGRGAGTELSRTSWSQYRKQRARYSQRTLYRRCAVRFGRSGRSSLDRR